MSIPTVFYLAHRSLFVMLWFAVGKDFIHIDRGYFTDIYNSPDPSWWLMLLTTRSAAVDVGNLM